MQIGNISVFLIFVMFVFVAVMLFGGMFVITKVFGKVANALSGSLANIKPPRKYGRFGPRMCPNEKCLKVEQRGATFCSQCGTSLPARGKTNVPAGRS